MLRYLPFLMFMMLVVSSATAADVAWTVAPAMQPKVATFLKTSPIAAEMRREYEPNKPVRVLKIRAPGLLMSDDLVACLHLTNPKSSMVIDSGGGFDINITDIEFPGGTWDVYIRVRELQKIDEINSTLVLVLDKMHIGNLIINDEERLTKGVKLLTKACYA